MSGMIPGVGVGPRRRLTQILNDDPSCRKYLRDPSDLSKSMDETTLRARQRLQDKLGNFYSIPRPGKIQPPRGRRVDKGGSGGLGKSWNSGIWRIKSIRKMCAVCLD